MALINHFLEVSLYVDDVYIAERFYRRLFDLETYAMENERHAFFRVGHCMLLLFEPLATRKGGSVPSHGALGAGHVAFTIRHEEIGFWRKRLTDFDIKIEHEHSWPSGGKSLYFRDPSGNSIELATADVWA